MTPPYPFDDVESYNGAPEVGSSISIQTREELDAFFTEKRFCQQRDDVLANIASRLQRARISHVCEACEILDDSYIRAVTHIENEKNIPCVVAWLKSTGFNVIREKRRKVDGQRKRSIKAKTQARSEVRNDILESSVEHNRLSSVQVLKNLSDLDERIFHHRKLMELSWKEVCLALAEEGLIPQHNCTDRRTINRIRRRGGRIIKKLRKGYSL